MGDGELFKRTGSNEFTFSHLIFIRSGSLAIYSPLLLPSSEPPPLVITVGTRKA